MIIRLERVAVIARVEKATNQMIITILRIPQLARVTCLNLPRAIFKTSRVSIPKMGM
jgi:hypothetical protein